VRAHSYGCGGREWDRKSVENRKEISVSSYDGQSRDLHPHPAPAGLRPRVRGERRARWWAARRRTRTCARRTPPHRCWPARAGTRACRRQPRVSAARSSRRLSRKGSIRAIEALWLIIEAPWVSSSGDRRAPRLNNNHTAVSLTASAASRRRRRRIQQQRSAVEVALHR
jgi:hypothetical protein